MKILLLGIMLLISQNTRAHSFRNAMDVCSQELGLSPSTGERPSKQERELMVACLKTKGFDKASRDAYKAALKNCHHEKKIRECKKAQHLGRAF